MGRPSELGCGTRCCFYEGSPCTQLEFTDAAKQVGRCKVYPERFGRRHTVSGVAFQCVPMIAKLKLDGVPHPKCGYNVVRSLEGVPIVRGMA